MIAWKFSIDFNNSPEFSKTELREMVAETANETAARVIGDDIYLTDLNDAFLFRMRVGHIVGNTEETFL